MIKTNQLWDKVSIARWKKTIKVVNKIQITTKNMIQVGWGGSILSETAS